MARTCDVGIKVAPCNPLKTAFKNVVGWLRDGRRPEWPSGYRRYRRAPQCTQILSYGLKILLCAGLLHYGGDVAISTPWVSWRRQKERGPEDPDPWVEITGAPSVGKRSSNQIQTVLSPRHAFFYHIFRKFRARSVRHPEGPAWRSHICTMHK